LIGKLDAAAEADGIWGEILLVPAANPIGLDQWRDEMIQGRFDGYSNINFNRQFVDMIEPLSEKIAGRLTESAEDNIDLIRQTAGEVLGGIEPEDEAEHLRHLLLDLAHDADIALDLHCDYQSVMHVYLGNALWPNAADLPAQMGAEATLLADDSGVTPFDEACSRIWWQLADRFPDYPIPPACLAATVELRGLADVSHAMAARDAQNIIHFLQRRGIIQGDPPDLPDMINPATPLSGVAHIKSKTAGVVVFCKEAGEQVAAGDLIAEVINPLAASSAERIHPIKSPIDGVLFARNGDCHARPGRILAKIAGSKPIKPEGRNLLTL
jgi:predicted deacylase